MSTVYVLSFPNLTLRRVVLYLPVCPLTPKEVYELPDITDEGQSPSPSPAIMAFYSTVSVVRGLTQQLTEDDDMWNSDYKVYSEAKQAADAITPKIAAVLSIIGSATMIAEIVVDHRKKKGQVLTRILLNLSVADIFSSTAWFFTTWAMPAGDLPHVVFNVGTRGTCTLQGFFIEMGHTAATLFNVYLSLTYLMIIKYNHHESRLRKREIPVYIGIWSFILANSIAPLFFGLYNAGYQVCYLNTYPLGCKTSYQFGEEANCIRGDSARIWALANLSILWICIFLIIGLLAMTICSVASTERRMRGFQLSRRERHTFGRASAQSLQAGAEISPNRDDAMGNSSSQALQRGSSRNDRQRQNMWRTKAMRQQALRYIGVFFVTFSGVTIVVVAYYTVGEWQPMFFYLDQIAFFFLPLQGFCNFVVFSWTRSMETSFGSSLQRVVTCRWCTCCTSWCSKKDDDSLSSDDHIMDNIGRGEKLAMGHQRISNRQLSGVLLVPEPSIELVPPSEELQSIKEQKFGESDDEDRGIRGSLVGSEEGEKEGRSSDNLAGENNQRLGLDETVGEMDRQMALAADD